MRVIPLSRNKKNVTQHNLDTFCGDTSALPGAAQGEHAASEIEIPLLVDGDRLAELGAGVADDQEDQPDAAPGSTIGGPW